MRRFGLREMRRMPEVVGSVIKEAVEDGLNAAVRKQRFEFESKGRLLVRNVSGDTEVEAWDKTTVLFDRDEGGLWKANEREGMIMAKVLSGDLRVKAPRRTGLNVNSVSGDIAVTGVQGKLEAKSVSGDIVLRKTGDALDVSTNSGDIKTRDIEGKCHITSVSGDIDLGFHKALNGLVETRTGDIQVWVPSDADVLLEAEIVLDGDIHNEVEAKCQLLEEKPHHLRLGFGKHQDHLWVRCRNGDITVRSYVAESGRSQGGSDQPQATSHKPQVEEEE